MSLCAYCNADLIFHCYRANGKAYCNTSCCKQDEVRTVRISAIPPQLLEQELRQLHQGKCPRCQGPGPVDFHHSYRVISVVVSSFHEDREHLCCRRCGLKAQASDLLLTLVIGWWDIHRSGLVMTPVQILRNLWAMINAPDPLFPSAKLRRFVEIKLSGNLAVASSTGPLTYPIAIDPGETQPTMRSGKSFDDLGPPLH